MDQEDAKRCGGGLLINATIDLDRVLTADGRRDEKKKVARRRWAILARALKSPSGSEPSSPTDECSVRRVSSFALVTTARLDDLPEPSGKRTWYKYSIQDLYVVVGHRRRTFSAEDLMGFNNTGNVCVWPSEETLAHYVTTNPNLFDGKRVLELGGGMSCLAGLFCAKYSQAESVLLTDGNKISIENAEASLSHNDFKCPVRAVVLKWGSNSISGKFDIILCADCLFFDEARSDLIKSFSTSLEDDGLGLVMAPRRGDTLSKFVEESRSKGFKCKEVVEYSETVWQKHLGLLANNEADYWKSQARKYCEFCKCWIADNKPSVEFHEKGRRHQDNVAKKLKFITKKSRREEKESLRTDAMLKQMENAALDAYRKDVENNADMSSAAIKKQLEENNLILSTSSRLEASGSSNSHPDYSVLTNNSEEVLKHKLKVFNKNMALNVRLRAEEEKKEEAELRAAEFREKMKERRVEPEPEPEPTESTSSAIIPPGKTDPYGQWRKVEATEAPTIDLQLPKREVEEYYEIPMVEAFEPPQREFKEKTVDSLGEGKAVFKKRKFGSISAKKNTRQRLDND